MRRRSPGGRGTRAPVSAYAAAIAHTPALRAMVLFLPHRCAGNVTVDDAERDQVCDAIVGYLQEHADAMDTLTGIADWWVARDRVRVSVERVAAALRTLEERGVVERVGLPGQPMFRLRRHD